MSLEDIKREALKLSSDDRDELVRTLFQSLDEEEEAGSALPAEVKRRYEAYKEGKTKPISLENLLAGLSTSTDIGTFIVRSPESRGGRPRVAGTGVTVMRIVGWYRLGLSPEEIADRIGHLSLAQVHAALAYYHANREEIDSDLAEENQFAETLAEESSRATDRS